MQAIVIFLKDIIHLTLAKLELYLINFQGIFNRK